MVNEGTWHVENAPASDHAGLCIWPWNEAAISSGAQGFPEQDHQKRWGAGWTKFAWTAGHESLLAGLESQDPGQGQEQDMSPAGSSSGWWWQTLQPGAAPEPHSVLVRLGSLVCCSGMDEPGLSLKPCLLPAQGPAVCHRPPPYKKAMRDFSKLVITSVFLSWIHLRWLITVMYRGSKSCPTLYFQLSPYSISLSIHLTLFLLFTADKKTCYMHIRILLYLCTRSSNLSVFPTPPINKLLFPLWGSALGIIPTSSGKGSGPGIPYE